MTARFAPRRCPRCLPLLLVLPALGLFGRASAVADTSSRVEHTLEDLPGYERYQLVMRNLRRLREGGSVQDVRWEDDGALRYRVGDQEFAVDLATLDKSVILPEPEPGAEADEADGAEGERPRRSRAGRPARGRQRDRETSPDRQWVAVCEDWNVSLQNEETGETRAITTDGTREHRYGTASWVYGEELDQRTAMWWSPDSRYLAFYEFDEKPVRNYYLLDGLTERYTDLMIEGYPKAGDPNPIAGLLIYDLEDQSLTHVDATRDPSQYVYHVRFAPSGDELLFNRTNRRQNVLELMAADPETGEGRVVLTETQETWQENRPTVRFLEDGQRFIWESERTGWKHYELRSLAGEKLVTLTSGSHPVERIVRVDEERGQLYYTAFSGENPLNVHLHRVNLDGTEPQRLTHREATHSGFEISPEGSWLIATHETVENPPATVLYSLTEDRQLELTAADPAVMDELDLSPPELFTYKADDGTTDLYGVLYKPSSFDPDHVYPLVISVYGGPLHRAVTNQFRGANPACEFGFVIAQIDNRGTPHRGKAFEAAAYMKLGDVDLRDQADGVRYLTKRPYIDAERVGVYGHSYGGYMTLMALLKYPELYHVGVAGGSVTDWRNYDTIYTERFMRTPQENESGYDAGSAMQLAHRLQGNLLLLHGMKDDNVHPSNVWQLIEALHAARRDFDMMFYPNAGHGLGPHASIERWRYLHEHLIQAQQTPLPMTMN